MSVARQSLKINSSVHQSCDIMILVARRDHLEMKQKDVKQGCIYLVKVGVNLSPVRLDSFAERVTRNSTTRLNTQRTYVSGGHWYGTNLRTGHMVRLTAAKCRRELSQCGCGRWTDVRRTSCKKCEEATRG
jgi:hypothetical protein